MPDHDVTTEPYASTATYDGLAARIAQASKIVLLAHAKPDGDAMGSIVALHRALSAQGRSPIGVLMGPVEPSLRSLAAPTSLVRLEETTLPDDPDLIIVVDTGSWAQLKPVEPWLRPRRAQAIGIDHHARGDDVVSERIVDTSCASTTQALVPLLEAMNAPITGGRGGVAEMLYMGLATDTGWFRYSNADAEAFALASTLLAIGVDTSRLFQVLEETARPARLALLGRALRSIRFVADGAAAVMALRQEDFAETGGGPEDLTGMVNEPMMVGAVRVSALVTEPEKGLSKISFRSKPAVDGESFVDVNQLAARLGGGGHVHAAGARLESPLDDAVERVAEELESAVASRST